MKIFRLVLKINFKPIEGRLSHFQRTKMMNKLSDFDSTAATKLSLTERSKDYVN